jgi:hypothetical protein
MKLFKTTTPENATHLARELDRARPKHDEEWIAPYELPTEEEIEEMGDEYINTMKDTEKWKMIAKEDFKQGVKAIINLLKGER